MIKFNSPDFKDFDKFKDYAKFGQLRRLGIFDSGIGGLSLLKYLCSQSPNDKQNNKEIIYLADSGRFPYGMKNPKEIFIYTKQIIRWLEQKNVDLIVFGCNTANAVTGDKLSQITQLPILDLIDPVAKYVSTLGLNVGVLATQATVNSHAFSKAIKAYAPELSIVEIAATQLVNIVETGDITSKETQDLLADYANQFASQGAEILILGCTHFSFLKDYLSPLIDKHIRILDPAELIAQLLTKFFQYDDQLTDNLSCANFVGEPTFFVTGDKEAFVNNASRCLGYPLKNVNQLSIANLECL
jgi:glutamate racemase